MNKSFFGIAIVTSLAFASCGNPPANDEVSAGQPITMPSASPGQTQQASPSTIVDMGQPGQTNQSPIPAQTVVSTPQQPVAKGSGALNPEHGKPGHRCDIAVGAPLNSPASAQPQPQPQQVQTITSTPSVQQVGPQITPIQPSQPTALPAAGKGRINPAHGQPGHDCAVPVGSPLN